VPLKLPGMRACNYPLLWNYVAEQPPISSLSFVPAVPLPPAFLSFFPSPVTETRTRGRGQGLTLKAKTKDFKIVLEDEELSFRTITLSITIPFIPYRCLPQAACVTAPPRSASLIISAPLHWRTQGRGFGAEYNHLIEFVNCLNKNTVQGLPLYSIKSLIVYETVQTLLWLFPSLKPLPVLRDWSQCETSVSQAPWYYSF